MARRIIWLQVGYAVAVTVVTFADQRALPESLGLALAPCLLAFPAVVFALPAVVLVLGARRASKAECFMEAVATVGLALVTVLVAWPMVQ